MTDYSSCSFLRKCKKIKRFVQVFIGTDIDYIRAQAEYYYVDKTLLIQELVCERMLPMFPTINLRETGVNLRRIMDKRGVTPKDIKEFLNLGSIQTVYNWFNGLNMPTVDNLYALSQFLQVPIDEIICGNRKAIVPELIVIIEDPRIRRLYAYYRQLSMMKAA